MSRALQVCPALHSSIRTQVVPIQPVSDGDASHAPSTSTHTKVDPPTGYLEKLATLWMKERKEYNSGVRYILDRLPVGYTVWEKPRKNGSNHVDKWCFGHPEHRSFDSPNRFFPHFLHLQKTSDSFGCPCTVCDRSASKTAKKTTSTSAHFRPNFRPKKGGPPASNKLLPSSKSNTEQNSSATASLAGRSSPSQMDSEELEDEVQPAAKPRGRPPKNPGQPKLPTFSTGFSTGRHVDDEGTPDIYRQLLNQLKIQRTVDCLISEPMSFDWRAEQAILPKMIEQVSQNAYVPRIGELVLFVRKLEDNEQLLYNPTVKHFEVYDNAKHQFTATPRWEAGVVTQTPHEKSPVKLKDLTHSRDTEYSVTYSGFRIEPLPNPNSRDKALSSRHKWVPIDRIRPFTFWAEVIGHISRADLHPTIDHAILVMSSISLENRYRFTGTWPKAAVWSKGLFVGSELILEGDLVRVTAKASEESNEITTVMKVAAIKFRMYNLDQASGDDYDDGHPYNSQVTICGPAWQMSTAHSDPENKGPMERLGPYGQWSLLHEPNEQLEVNFSRVIGRVYEHDAMKIWFPNEESTHLSKGLDGVRLARQKLTKSDERIKDGKTWFWADTRVEALDLHTFNGLDTAKYDQERDPKQMRRYIKILEGAANQQDREQVKAQVAVQKNLRNLGMFAHRPDLKPETSSESESSRSRERLIVRHAADFPTDNEPTSADISAQVSRATSPRRKILNAFKPSKSSQPSTVKGPEPHGRTLDYISPSKPKPKATFPLHAAMSNKRPHPLSATQSAPSPYKPTHKLSTAYTVAGAKYSFMNRNAAHISPAGRSVGIKPALVYQNIDSDEEDDFQEAREGEEISEESDAELDFLDTVEGTGDERGQLAAEERERERGRDRSTTSGESGRAKKRQKLQVLR